MSNAAYEAAAAAATDLLVEEQGDEAPDEGEQPEASAVDTDPVQHEAEELPDDLREELELPDFEAEAELEVEAEEPGEWEDDATKDLRKQLRATEKRNVYLEAQRLRSELPHWKQEAEKYFPYANLDKIDATSRRAFLKAAKTQHEEIAATVDRVVAAKLDGFDVNAERERLRAEVKAEAEQMWGKPTITPSVPPAEAKANAEKVDAAFERGGLAAGIREMLTQEVK